MDGPDHVADKITLIVDGQPRELEADYLSPAALEYWHAWLANEARMAHNPFVEFAAKVRRCPKICRPWRPANSWRA